MKRFGLLVFLIVLAQLSSAQDNGNTGKVMSGFPPSRESQVTFQNYRDYPFSKWSFRNMSAPMHTLMIPRGGPVHEYKSSNHSIGQVAIASSNGSSETFETIFAKNEADGVIVLQNNTILFEKYWNGLGRDYQHIWFSITKSLTSSALGILVSEGKIDLSVSPIKYVSELKGTPWERTTIQDVINMSTAMGFAESYTDTASFFYKHYGGASHFFYVPGADATTTASPILGTYDFLTRMATANENMRPGYKFEYNSTNVDVISWIMSNVTGKPYNEFIHEKIWSKLGAEHDAYITADRAYTAMATGGMNSTLRDAALFGMMILNRGKIDGKQIIPSQWVDETLKINEQDRERMKRNDVYFKAGMPSIAYKNFWWILDETKGEYAGLGIHGQLIYINRAANLVIAYFSSQPVASSAASKHFLPKLNACRELSKRWIK